MNKRPLARIAARSWRVQLLRRRSSLLFLSLSLALAADSGATTQQFEVGHATAGAAYLLGGSIEGLVPGRHLQVLREGQVIALLEVAYVTASSGSCRILEQSTPLLPGDIAVVLPEYLSDTEPSTTLSQGGMPPAPAPQPGELERRSRGELSGTLYLQAQSRKDAAEREWQDSTARLSLRARNIGGHPLSFVARSRSRERTRSFGSEALRDQREDRVYELSLTYHPQQGRSLLQIGRLGSSAPIGSGYLDGLLAQKALSKHVALGGFYGLDPEVDDRLFDSDRTKYGAYLAFNSLNGSSPGFAEVLLSAIGEYTELDLSREYLYVQSRFGWRGRWSIYQQAELDFNRDWRLEATGETYQLSNLSFAGTVRFSSRFRGSLSWDQRRRFRDIETREIPDEVFDDLLREGVRATLYFHGHRGLNFSLGVGRNGGEGDTPSLDSLSASINHGNVFGKAVFLGLDVSAFRGATSEGRLATARIRKYLRAGHDFGLTLGYSESQSLFAEGVRQIKWARFETVIQLPWRLFLLAEFEMGFGLEAQTRELVQLGYRF